MDGFQSNRHASTRDWDTSRIPIANSGAVIKMQSDFHQMAVKFKIDGEEVTCFKWIWSAPYRAVITMCEGSETIKLISHHKF